MRASFDTDLLISFSLGQVFLFFVCHTSEFLKRETTITILKTKSINSSGTLEPFLRNISPDRKWWKFFWQPCLPNLRCSIKALNHFFLIHVGIVCYILMILILSHHHFVKGNYMLWTFEKKNCLHPLELVPSDKAIAVSINPSESSLFIEIGWVKIYDYHYNHQSVTLQPQPSLSPPPCPALPQGSQRGFQLHSTKALHWSPLA